MTNKRLSCFSKNSCAWILAFLFSLSLVIRIVFWLPVARNNIPLVYDEAMYFDRAVGIAAIIQDYLQNRPLQAVALEQAYGRGWWPPLHSAIIAIGLLLSGGQIFFARLIMVFASAITTLPVYLTTANISSRKAALWAAGIHIIYPSFIAYSHYLWSETTFIFLLFSMLFVTIRLPLITQKRKKYFYAAAAGILLGLCALTRAAALPYLAVIPLWLAYVLKQKLLRLLIPGIVVFACILVLLPWQSVLVLKEQHFVFMGVSSEMSLYYGNNPLIPPGKGHYAAPSLMNNLQPYSRRHSVSIPEAARALAVLEIKTNVGQFVKRCFIKFKSLWTYDGFLLRHIFQVVYPPMPETLVVAVWISVFVSFTVLIILGVFGALLPGIQPLPKLLIVLLLFGGMVPPIITNAFCRLHIPLLAVLLPFAGHAAAHGTVKKQYIPVATVLVLGVFLCWLNVSEIPGLVDRLYKPSSYYSGLINRFNSVAGSKTAVTDRIKLKAYNIGMDDQLTITALGGGYFFNKVKSNVMQWNVAPGNQELSLSISGQNIKTPLLLRVSSKRLKQSVLIQPVKKSSWRIRQPLGLHTLEIIWPGYSEG